MFFRRRRSPSDVIDALTPVKERLASLEAAAADALTALSSRKPAATRIKMARDILRHILSG